MIEDQGEFYEDEKDNGRNTQASQFPLFAITILFQNFKRTASPLENEDSAKLPRLTWLH